MSVIVKHIPHTVDLNEPVKKTHIDTLLATEDNLAHCFDITLKQGVPSGAAVTAYFIRYSDNATISLTGTVSGNVASVTLNKACYNKAGQFAVIIKVVADGVTNTVFYGEGTIFTSMTDTILDPENVVHSLSDLLAQISAMETATAASKTATTNAKSATTRANNAAAKIEGMTASAVDAETAGVTVSEVDGVKHFAFELPKGPKGDPGTIENVTITSINGLPEALAGKLGKTETASDSAKLGGKAPEYYLQPVNLLDNSDFTNSVNQRGQTSYTGNGYTIDRWRTAAATTTHELTSGGIKVFGSATANHSLQTSLENPAQYVGKTLTLCAFIEENNEPSDLQIAIYYGAGSVNQTGTTGVNLIIPAGTTGLVCASGIMPDMGSYACSNVCIRSRSGTGSFVVKWAALYEGEYTADNLPPYVPKEEVAELLSCQKQLLVYRTIGTYSVAFAHGFCHNATTARFCIDIPVPMQMDTPSISTNETTWNIRSGGTNFVPTEVTILRASGNKLHIQATTEGLTVGETCELIFYGKAGADSHVLISAEL